MTVETFRRLYRGYANKHAVGHAFDRDLDALVAHIKNGEPMVCSSCGCDTGYGCADCRIRLRKTVYVCGKPECRDEHEKTCKV